jgi:hypothetical protein
MVSVHFHAQCGRQRNQCKPAAGQIQHDHGVCPQHPVLKNQKEWITNTPLLTTSAEALGKTMNEGTEDIPGPLNVAVAAENKGNKAPSKTVVIGNAYFATDDGRDSAEQAKNSF